MHAIGKPVLLSVVAFAVSFAFLFLITLSSAEAREEREVRSSRPILDAIQVRVCDRLEKVFARIGRPISLPKFCTNNPPPPPPSPTVDINALPLSITLGATSTLSWTSTNASSCTASAGWTGAKTLSGSLDVSPPISTSYTLACGNGISTTSDSVTVIVNIPVPHPTLSLDANPSTIPLGATSSLAWTSTNATYCEASNGWNGSKSLNGNIIVSPTITTIYTLACGNTSGTTTDSATVTVTQPIPLPSVTLGANPNTIQIGATSSLVWSSTNANFCVASDGWSGTKSFSGNLVVNPISTTLYTLMCGNTTGTTTATSTLTVTPLPDPTVSLDTASSSILVGATTTLTWTSTNAGTCIASNGWSGEKSLSGSVVINPSITTTYTLDCGNGTSTSTDSTTVTVTNLPLPIPTVTIEVDDDTINYEADAMLTWSSTDATSCVASGGWSGSKALGGSETVEPLATTTYMISCGNGVSTSSDSVIVNVILPPAPTVLITADPNEIIGEDDVTTIEWSSANATACVASGGWSGAKSLVGNEEISPDVTAAYGLTCSGPGGTGSATTTVVFTPLPEIDHLVISEVYYDVDATHGVETDNEWVELYNPTNSTINLAGWSFTDGATTTDFIPSGVTIAAHGFAIFLASSTTIPFWTFPAGIPLVDIDSPIGSGLGNIGDSLYLMNTASTTIDAISWDANTTVMNPSIVGVAAGHSIARSSFTVDTNTATDWIDRTTPTPGL